MASNTLDQLERLIYSECSSPVKIQVYSDIDGGYIYKDVPCGKCYHCKITKINEWVTRMVCQSNYSKYVYYGTLTYNGKVPTILNGECLSINSTFNKNNAPNDTPILLRKDHVQKFMKRLRKNTGIKFQYVTCGEYGSTYSRPHFHYIIWSNDPISTNQVKRAWHADRVDGKGKTLIGKVEHRDIKNNPDPKYKDPDGTWAFKYVAKYVNKLDFDFERLTNLKQHKDLYDYYFNPDTTCFQKHLVKDLYSNVPDDFIKAKNVTTWDEYKKTFSPFFLCSKKPAIGYQYLQDHIAKYKDGDFRLFGLPKDYIFPLYFIRKTKESLCPLKAQSETNSTITSSNRLPKMAALLDNIITAQQIYYSTEGIIKLFKCPDTAYQYNPYTGEREPILYNSIDPETGKKALIIDQHYTLESYDTIQDLEALREEGETCIKVQDDVYMIPNDTTPSKITHYRFKREYLGFRNTATKVDYVFRGDYFAMYNTKGHYLGDESLENVTALIKYYYGLLRTKLLNTLHAKSEISAHKKAALIASFGGEQEFLEHKASVKANMDAARASRQRLYKLSKTFE